MNYPKTFRSVCARSWARPFSSEGRAVATALHDLHVENGGKMVDFGGFALPVQYSDQSIVNSHLFTRRSASMFDVSHMLQTEMMGRGCVDYLESVCTADLRSLPTGSSTLTVFTNEKGGILDDLIVTKIEEDHLFVVSNASRRDHDRKHLLQALDAHRRRRRDAAVRLHFFGPQERSLLALQGPKAAAALQRLTNVDLSELYFMRSVSASVCGVELCRVTRCGYTGEDGFEVSAPSVKVADIAAELLKDEDVKLAGLGARDSLRLEAGLCLYGSDITEETSPVEAALAWVVARARRERGDFPGAKIILGQIGAGPIIRRVGLVSLGGPPPRHGAIVLSEGGDKVYGSVTSGGPSPSLSRNIAMAYVPVEFSGAGTRLKLQVRGKLYAAEVVRMPFVPAKYYAAPK